MPKFKPGDWITTKYYNPKSWEIISVTKKHYVIDHITKNLGYQKYLHSNIDENYELDIRKMIERKLNDNK